MARLEFDLRALYDALDAQKRSRKMSWADVARAIGRFKTPSRPIAQSTITRLKTQTLSEGDGILQMLLWLRRTPESFVAGMTDADDERFQLPDPGDAHILRWDTRALHLALDAERRTRSMTWQQVAEQVGGFTPAMLTHLAKGGRTAFPGVMRLVSWLGQPAATFTRASDW